MPRIMRIWILSCVIMYIYSILGYIACIPYTQQKVSLRMYFAIWTHYSSQLIQQQQTSHGHCLPKKRMVVPSMRFNIGSIRNPIHSDGMAFPHTRWKAMTHPDHDTHGDCLDIPVPVTHETEVANATFLQWLSHVWFPGGKCSCLRSDPYLVGETNKKQQQNSLNFHLDQEVKSPSID